MTAIFIIFGSMLLVSVVKAIFGYFQPSPLERKLQEEKRLAFWYLEQREIDRILLKLKSHFGDRVSLYPHLDLIIEENSSYLWFDQGDITLLVEPAPKPGVFTVKIYKRYKGIVVRDDKKSVKGIDNVRKLLVEEYKQGSFD